MADSTSASYMYIAEHSYEEDNKGSLVRCTYLDCLPCPGTLEWTHCMRLEASQFLIEEATKRKMAHTESPIKHTRLNTNDSNGFTV